MGTRTPLAPVEITTFSKGYKDTEKKRLSYLGSDGTVNN